LPQQGYWSFRDHKERVTEVAIPPEAGQWLGEITLKRLARYAQRTILSLDLGPGEKGRTDKWAPLFRRKMTFHFSTMMVP
jgi:hypothetical protein